MTRVAAFDLGSNSFHMLVADVSDERDITRVLRRKVMLGLGTTVATEGRLGPRLDEIIETLRELVALALEAGVQTTVVCATAAFRDAGDREECVAAIAEATGLRVVTITGEQEARIIFHAIRASMALHPAPAMCIDLGGGSLEITVGDDLTLASAASVPLGVARLTAEHVRNDPPSPKDVRRLQRAITAELEPLLPVLCADPPRLLVGSSGTLKNLATAALYRRDGVLPDSLHEATVTAGELCELHDALVGMTSQERETLPGVEARRAPLIVAGSTVALSVMAAVGLEAMTISEWALREGMLLAGAELGNP